MIIVKVINQKVVQVAFAGTQQTNQQLFKQAFGQSRCKLNLNTSHSLVQSARRCQKVTNANNQYLIPIARNISFRQCHQRDQNSKSTSSNVSKFSFSISSASNQQADYMNPTASIFINQQEENKVSPLDKLRQKAKDVVDKRETAAKSKYYGQIFNKALASTSTNERKLVVLMSWLEAKEKHIEKYRQFYLDRGFDVLNVKTSALDLLLPTVGAKKISKDFARFMLEKQYSDVLLHGFSVGGYMFGQVLLDIDRQGNKETKDKLLNSIRGIVFDSLVPFEGTCIGVANSITDNKYLAKILENLLKLYLYLGKNIATKYYKEASEKVWGGPLRCPSLFLLSRDDKISDYRIILRLGEVWSKLGIECHHKIWESSPHVQMFIKHNEEYVSQVENFLKRINMDQGAKKEDEK